MKIEPVFDNLLAVLERTQPDRETLFEFFLNEPLCRRLANPDIVTEVGQIVWGGINRLVISAFANAGYDYVTCYGSNMTFPAGEINRQATISLNAGSAIRDRKSFKTYDWPKADAFDYSRLDQAIDLLPRGMKLIVYGPGGVLENAISLVGFDHLCLMLTDDPELAIRIFDAIGSSLVRYYEICSAYPSVGALIANDDWGFKTQTMLAPDDLRRYVFPWHRRIVEVIHTAGKPAILHSCGYTEEIMDDIIDIMKYDAKHSFEDAIEPVENAYERWGHRIAILGGIDLDFVCRSRPQEIQDRCRSMLDRAKGRGGYALGTGNSIPEYVPDENYFAMINTVLAPRCRHSVGRPHFSKDGDTL
ncbi:MAG: hypothetical protein JW828_13540 [Sedimentisphaerales bacterium]|nr:hypothetical protein [Sedimentisphaerales bacterium]